MKWHSIQHLPRLADSYHRIISGRNWALILVSRKPPIDQSRKAGEL